MSLVIVDTGVANLASVKYAFERLGVMTLTSDDPAVISGADRVLLPGVGAAPFAMKSIENKGLRPVLKALRQPVMGICLGMQLLFDELAEGDVITPGLGLIEGKVGSLATGDLPSPHMGWNTLSVQRPDPILDGISDNDYAYFVHSYAVPVENKACLASAEYGEPFAAVVRQGHVWGCQFHPERSSKTGAQILENFMKVTA